MIMISFNLKFIFANSDPATSFKNVNKVYFKDSYTLYSSPFYMKWLL